MSLDPGLRVDPDLRELAVRCEQAGDVVVPHGDHVCIRLGLLSSVRVRSERGRLRCDPRFGMLRRTPGLYVDQALGIGIVALVGAASGVGVPLAVAGITGVMVAVYDACRFVATENCVARLQTMWAARHGGVPLAVGSAPAALGAPVESPMPARAAALRVERAARED